MSSRIIRIKILLIRIILFIEVVYKSYYYMVILFYLRVECIKTSSFYGLNDKISRISIDNRCFNMGYGK